MRMYDIIYKKRMGNELTREEIDYFVRGYTNGDIPDYQISALLMAICFSSMNKNETLYLTDAMLRSGDTVDLSSIDGICADKHSTGGVGDKTTLIVAPIVSSLGVKIAKMSGRGLGFTGGTVDKLESIDGYKTSLSSSEFLSVVKENGICVVGQSGNLAPADKKLYALRDVTATVDSIPLIASSIMSKKLASGADTIVLDVKTGSGAFMKSKDDSLALARAMVEIGKGFGKNVRALITNMDEPLGYNIGNSLEVMEAIQILKGYKKNDLYTLCIELSANMVSASLGIDINTTRELCVNSVESGNALCKMKEWITAQGGDSSLIDDEERLTVSPYKRELLAERDGYISKICAETVGEASMLLGAGRKTKDDEIDLGAGIVLKVKIGHSVRKNEPLALLYSSDESLFLSATEKLSKAFAYSDDPPKKEPLIYETVT